MVSYDNKERVVTLIKLYNLTLGRADLNASTKCIGETPGFWLGESDEFTYTIPKFDDGKITHFKRT